MDCETESDSTSSSDPECDAWQEIPDTPALDDQIAEQYIKNIVENWLTEHGKTLFSLEASKFLVKEKKKRTCSLKEPKHHLRCKQVDRYSPGPNCIV